MVKVHMCIHCGHQSMITSYVLYSIASLAAVTSDNAVLLYPHWLTCSQQVSLHCRFVVINAPAIVAALYTLFYLCLEPFAGLTWSLFVGVPMWIAATAFQQLVSNSGSSGVLARSLAYSRPTLSYATCVLAASSVHHASST